MEALSRFNQDVHYEIDNVCTKHNIPNTARQEAKDIYDNFITQDYAWSRPEYHFAVASVYFACRKYDLPYTIRDLKREDDDLSNVTKTFRTICSELGDLPEPQDPTIFVDRIHDGLGSIPNSVLETAKEVIEKTDPATISGKQPNTVAAAAYYVATKLNGVNITQELIGKQANVSSVAIRNTYRDLHRP